MKKYILFAAAALTMAACTNENDPVTPADGEVAARIVADIDHVATRASGTDWAHDDRIGISCTSTDNKTNYTNIPYKWDDHEKIFKSDGTVIYFQSDKVVTFNAYYPYDQDGSIEATTDAEAQKNLPAIDFLYATGATADKNQPDVYFTGDAAFHHRMSQITLEFEEGNDMSFAGKLTSYTLKEMMLKGSFNTETGEAKATASEAVADLTIGLPSDLATTSKKYTAAPVILFPQEVTEGKIALEVIVEDEIYRATLTIPDADKDGNKDTDLKSGYNYKFPVKVRKSGLAIGDCKIADWDTAPADPTDATM